MPSVTKRIKQITTNQPKGGYLPARKFKKVELPTERELYEYDLENIHASLVGTAVDYLTRFMMSNNKEYAFNISLLGAKMISQTSNAVQLLNNINGLDNTSVVCACKLVGYDTVYRAGANTYKDISLINPNEATIENIRIMVNRSLEFFKLYGPIVKDGFTFEGAYTDVVNSGDGDFLTKDTLWDFKVTKGNVTKDHTLQLLMYYIMGKKSIHREFDNIDKVGIYNPRKNIVYLMEMSEVEDSVIKDVEYNVIGYGNDELNRMHRQAQMQEMMELNARHNTPAKPKKKTKKQKQKEAQAISICIVFVIIVLYYILTSL